MSPRKAALIEIYDSHDVNLYSQLLFLKKGGYDTTLIVSGKHRKEVKDYDAGQQTMFVNVTGTSGLAQWKELWKIRRYLIDAAIDTVIFNTAHSNPVRNFCLLPFPKRVRFYGTLHGVNKLAGSLTQKLISRRIPAYYLLSDYMLEKAMKMPHAGLRFEVYYPIFHPQFPAPNVAPKEAGTLWIAIPGAVEYKRRDYLTLLDAFAAIPQKPRIKFLLLGNGDHAHGNGPELQEKVAKLGLQDYFLFYHGFMPNDVFHYYIQHCDAILPLIHPINADMEKYLENQISGSFNLGFGYRKPLLMHRYFSRYDDFHDTSLFYDLNEMSEFLSALPELLPAIAPTLFRLPKWTLDYQAAHYLSLLEK